MGTQYVDDHRFLLCKGSTVTDITRAVSQPEARDELDALSVELTFTAVRNNNRDKYMHWYGIEPGDKLRVVNHGREVFSGVILTVGLDGTVTANVLVQADAIQAEGFANATAAFAAFDAQA